MKVFFTVIFNKNVPLSSPKSCLVSHPGASGSLIPAISLSSSSHWRILFIFFVLDCNILVSGDWTNSSDWDVFVRCFPSLLLSCWRKLPLYRRDIAVCVCARMQEFLSGLLLSNRTDVASC